MPMSIHVYNLVCVSATQPWRTKSGIAFDGSDKYRPFIGEVISEWHTCDTATMLQRVQALSRQHDAAVEITVL